MKTYIYQMNKTVYFFIILLFLFPVTAPAQSSIVQANPSLVDQFPKLIGNLRLSETTVQLGNVYNNETKLDTVRIYNSSANPMSISIRVPLPEYIKLQIVPEKLDAGKEGKLLISYAASMRKEFGFVFDRIMLGTNDPLQSDKNINITATINEYFAPGNPADSMLIPRARLSESTYGFGRVQEGVKAQHNFTIFNDGQKDLVIHHSKSDCGCIKTSFSKMTVLPGDSAVLSLEFDSFGKSGALSRDLSVFVSDPKQPELRLSISAEVWK